jgi:predicted ATPase
LTEKPPAPTLRSKVSTGYVRLDESTGGGFFEGSAILLASPASSEVPVLVRGFLKASNEPSLLISRTQSSAEAIAHPEDSDLKCLICSDKPASPAKNMLPGKGIDNLTELNFQINETINSTQPRRVALEILSDILLRHKALQSRKWLSELLEKLRSKSITTLAVLNPYMHTTEETHALVDLFDGNVEVIEKDVDGQLQKFLRIRWINNIEPSEKEFPLLNLTPETQATRGAAPVQAPPLKEPRWLTPLISRTAELSKLRAAFDNAVANRASVVALQGEVGVGKTRLMQELAVFAQSKGALVLSGSASEDGLPYAPWIELVRQYIAQAPGEVLRRMLGSNASELVKLVPDITAKLGTIPPSKALGELQDKMRFYEAVTQFFIGVCKDVPLLMLFDDMQYVDQASLDLLEYFSKGTSNLRILTVCSCPIELEANSPLSETLLKLNKQRLLELISVRNLSKDDTANLIKQVFGEGTVSPEFADLIYERTGGNPFFVEEVLRSLVEEGAVFRTEKGWERKPIQDVVIPESVKTALRSRLTKLDPQTVSVLQWAAVTGSDFDFDVLREASQLGEDTILQLLETAITKKLLIEVRGEKGRLRFVDSRIRELLVDDLIQLKRTRYHLKIAEAMERVYSKDLERHAETLATHFSEGGNLESTIKYSIMAGDRNRSLHANGPAIAQYQRTLDLLEEVEWDQREKALILEKIAPCYYAVGEPKKSVEDYEQALALFEKLGDFGACARICATSAEAVYDASSEGALAAIEAVKRGLKYLGSDQESSEAATVYARLAWYLGLLDRLDEAKTWFEKASVAAEKSKNFTALTDVLLLKGCIPVDSGKIDEGLPILEESTQLALDHEIYQQSIDGLLNLAVYTYPRDLAEASDFLQRRIQLSKSVNDVVQEARGIAHLSYFDWLKGEFSVALNQINKAFEVVERLGWPPFNLAEATRAWIFLSMGKLEETEKTLQTLSDRKDPKISSIVALNLSLGTLRMEENNLADARKHFESAVEAFKPAEFTTYPLLHIEVLLRLTSLYAREGRLDDAGRMNEWSRRLAETLKSNPGLAMAAQAEAALLLAKGEEKGAAEAYVKSLTLWEKAGWPYYQAKALVAYSDSLAQTNPEEANKRLQEAAEIFKRLGAKRDLERAEVKLSAK